VRDQYPFPGQQALEHTLNANMNVLLRLLDLTCVFVGLREGVYHTSQ
jgi:hypothetical protein